MEGEGMSEELKPCPFCGGEALFETYGGTACAVVCQTCHCGTATARLYDGMEAVKAWNRRAERTCLAKPYEVDGETGFYDCIECECGEVNDVSARYCNGCGGLIEVVYE